MTLLWLFHAFLLNFKWISHDFLMIFLDFLMTFSDWLTDWLTDCLTDCNCIDSLKLGPAGCLISSSRSSIAWSKFIFSQTIVAGEDANLQRFFLSVSLSVCMYVFFVCISVFLSACMSVCMSVCGFLCQSVSLWKLLSMVFCRMYNIFTRPGP